MNELYLLGEVARILNRRPHQISYLLTSGQAREPERRIANERLFSVEDVLGLARQMRVTPDWSTVERDSADRQAAPEASFALTPPFEAVQVGETGCEVRDGDGAVFAWTSDRASALIIAGLLESAVRG